MVGNYHHKFGNTVTAFYLRNNNTVKYAKMHQMWTLNFLEVVRQHILGAVGTVTIVL